MRSIPAAFLTAIVFCIAVWPFNAIATTVIYKPTDDGDLYGDGTTRDQDYVTVGKFIHGDIHFAFFDSSQDTQIQLEINPYSLPLGGPVSVYGIDNEARTLQGSNYAAGSYLGEISFPFNGVEYGEQFYLDVTNFIHSVAGPYIAFVLINDSLIDPDQFSSLHENYFGTPSELIATPIPEPSALALLATGTLGLLFARRRFASGPVRC